MHAPYRRATLVALDLFLGVSALVGGLSVIPTLPAEWLAGTPFPDFTLPAVALTLLGVAALAGAPAVIFRPRAGAALSAATGAGLVV
ncbi:MAG TPA: hypothetical protein VFX49_05050, partial [Chloroflexota bacterium]|nr:hypothetical protein [Chloroflexota bacterium]